MTKPTLKEAKKDIEAIALVSLHSVTVATGTPKKTILNLLARKSGPQAPTVYSAIKLSRSGNPIEELFIPLAVAQELFGLPKDYSSTAKEGLTTN